MTIAWRDSGNMLDDIPQDMPDSACHVILVCPCNTIAGVMGKGLALSFAKRWPRLPRDHMRVVNEDELKVGRVAMVWVEPSIYVAMFPTKKDWRRPSQLRWIYDGMFSLCNRLDDFPDCQRVVIPALGCGLGGLEWADVRPMIQVVASLFPQREFIVYGPQEQR